MTDPTLPIHADIQRLLGEFRECWSRAEKPTIESFVDRANDSCRDLLLKNLISLEAEFRRQAGETANVGEYLSRFPELSAETINVLLANQSVTEGEAGVLPPRYLLQREIARGGMGKVLHVFDRNLDRDLALKIMLPHATKHPDLIRRFQREARITGGLQHPGIPSVVELGELNDGAPFFSMKLVRGKTLTDLLKSRTDADRELDRLLPVYEQIAQTLAYAHDRGTIHRDLKPANVMVGAFGEVQVMDWGMAKQRGPQSDASNDQTVDDDPLDGAQLDGEQELSGTLLSTINNQSISGHESTVVPDHSIDTTWVRPEGETPITSDRHELTEVGSVLGTPSYMAPEQARGEIDTLEARADVFAFGAMLLEMLVGHPPFLGATALDRLNQAAKGALEPARAMLAKSDADPALIELTRSCLEAEPDRRPANGMEVANTLTKYLESLQQRLEEERVQRAEAEVRSQEEHKRRRLSLAITALGFLLFAGIAGASVWLWQERTQRQLEAQFEAEQVELEVSSLIEQASILRIQGEWDAGRTLLTNAHDRLKDQPQSTHGDLAKTLRNAQIDLDAAEAADRIVFKPYEMKYDEFSDDIRRDGFRGRDGSYAVMLNDYLLKRFEISSHILDLDESQLAQLKTSPILTRVINVVDKWANESTHDDVQIEGYQLGIALDSNSGRKRIRQACLEEDKSYIEEMARAVMDGQHELETIQLLARVPLWEDKDELRLAMLRQATARFPSDFELRMTAAFLLQDHSEDEDYQQSFVEAATGASALEPDNASAMFFYAGSQLATGQFEASAEAFSRVIEIDPRDTQAYRNLSVCLFRLNRADEAYLTMEKAFENNPDDWKANEGLGTLYYDAGRLTEARDLLENSIELREANGNWYEPIDGYILTLCYLSLGDPEKAMEAFRLGLRDNPNFTNTLGVTKDLLQSMNRFEDAYEVLDAQLESTPSGSVAHAGLLFQRTMCALQTAYFGTIAVESETDWQLLSIEAGEQFMTNVESLVSNNSLSSEERIALMEMLESAQLDETTEPVRAPQLRYLPDNLRSRWQDVWIRLSEITED